MFSGLACLVRFNNRLYTLAIIIMLHLALSFRPTPLCEYTNRTEQMEDYRKREAARRGGDGVQAYLQLPEDLRLPAGLKVLQSLGPEAVLLVQGAVATRRADESMTTQEPKRESSMVVSRPLLRTKAAWEMQCACV